MYKFMSLASVSAAWNSRKGAAFGFASIAAKAGEQVDARTWQGRVQDMRRGSAKRVDGFAEPRRM